MTSVERWDIFELTLTGPTAGNPFVDVQVGATFSYLHRTVPVDGFYDGDGVYRVRFMPDTVGEWRYVTHSSDPTLDGHTGTFTCTPAHPGNHGPVRVAQTHHFAYADGTPHMSVGTTCYAWVHQGDALEEQTLATLAAAPFNKLRMCVFPKHYRFNDNEPVTYAYARNADGGWDFSRFNPAFWQHLEQRIAQLRDLGIEADLILFHPYDRWGFADMGAAADDRYLRYAVARLAAYRNVWWSLANEFDIMPTKSMADWDRFFHILQAHDPYQHLRSIHNCIVFYDHAKPWVTHVSVQSSEIDQVRVWRERYGKPVVMDECKYEGNIERNWGNISAQEMVHRFWWTTVNGGYAGHGETYLHPQDILWWAKGGVLHGESAPRIAFLRRLLEEHAAPGLDLITIPHNHFQPHDRVRRGEEYYLYYFGIAQPARFPLELPADKQYVLEVIDPWAMTLTPLAGTYSGSVWVDLPGRPYLGVHARRVA